MDNKRYKVYITIFVITTVIAACVAVYFAIEANNKTVENDTQVGKVEEVTTDEVDKTQTNVEIKEVEKIVEVEKELSQENIDKIARVTIDDYLNLTGAIFYSGDGALSTKYLPFFNNVDDYNARTNYEDNMLKTDIKYEEFIAKIEKYMTKELFEKNYLNIFYKNVDGYVAVLAGGATGFTKYVTSVELISKNSNEYEYKAKYDTFSIGDPQFDNEVVFKLKNVNGSYVISECSK